MHNIFNAKCIMHNAYWGAFAALFFCDFLNANFVKLYEFREKNFLLA